MLSRTSTPTLRRHMFVCVPVKLTIATRCVRCVHPALGSEAFLKEKENPVIGFRVKSSACMSRVHISVFMDSVVRIYGLFGSNVQNNIQVAGRHALPLPFIKGMRRPVPILFSLGISYCCLLLASVILPPSFPQSVSHGVCPFGFVRRISAARSARSIFFLLYCVCFCSPSPCNMGVGV